jgi:hypothetical protein
LATLVVTRWNSFCLAFERAAKLQNAFDLYINYWCGKQKIADIYARSRSNKAPDAPSWMRSGGHTAADWQVGNEYIPVLQPLEEATKRPLRRNIRSYPGFRVPRYLLDAFEEHVRPFEDVEHEQYDAPKDHLVINSRGAWANVSEYFSELDDSPVYYADCCLHPYY